jgi:hypothetical protein
MGINQAQRSLDILVENRVLVLSLKWHLYRLAYEPRLRGFLAPVRAARELNGACGALAPVR